ncbi:1-acyl-sn-glycerol-3-phosphate acyltransferase [Kordiimonas sp. SCSIO 12610]|uniref:lysophospholipid acyltransferase family protein n=1 Tax=Kordiimonas sp. SCSIO 12610 TaxID=2829597 RepID=UPI00210EB542|nr:lysophospholipid acyltransferase family protein [Kordiimonas sp. SCSIO 12610]UTW55090.1 1-acyl-sn-glycerol-3-phosphate acyltransferase [Kordiimonas sp. SCSIO 12610]
MSVEYAGLKSTVSTEGWSLRGIVRTSLLIAMSIPVLSLQFLLVRFSKKHWWSLAGFWHRTACRIIGLKVHEIGQAPHGQSTLYVANHISWVDILVLGGILKNSSFVAKSEIAGWGMIGSVCALQKTLFINRTRRSDSLKQRDELTDRIKDGNSLILFPEGTSTNGMQVAPFKSALFSVAEMANHGLDESLCIQPITLSYTEVNGMPLVRSQKPWVAWIGDMELLLHLKQFLGRARIVATVEYHAPISLEQVGSRKNAALTSEQLIREGLERAHRAEYNMGKRKHGPEKISGKTPD